MRRWDEAEHQVFRMNRIRVVGGSGSGKTTTAAAIAARMNIPHLELDAVHWLPEWRQRDPDEFRRIVLEFAAQPRWVIDGNYSGRLGDHIDHLVDTYVWLDLPRWRAVAAVFRRTVRRAVAGEELWGTGNRERLSSLWKRDPLASIVLWSWTQHGRYRAQNEANAQAGSHPWVRLRSRRELKRFLETLVG